MKYEFLEDRVVDSFNRLITSISKVGGKVLLRQTKEHSDIFESLLDHSMKRESEQDLLLHELFFTQNRLKKASLVLEMMIEGVFLDELTINDIYDLNKMRKGGFYTAKSFMEANDALISKKMLKSLGCKFSGTLNLHELRDEINQSQQKLIKKYETTKNR